MDEKSTFGDISGGKIRQNLKMSSVVHEKLFSYWWRHSWRHSVAMESAFYVHTWIELSHLYNNSRTIRDISRQLC